MRIKALAIAACALALSACAHTSPDGGPYMGGKDNFGEANRQTMMAQVIDPAPIYDTAIPETHGEHAAQAVDRYRRDKVKLPDKVKTNDTDLTQTAQDNK